MTHLTFSVLFTLGLVSGLHCLQMCGPLVLTYSLTTPREQALRTHLAYNAGRISTYMLLGALAGVLGSAFASLGRIAGLTAGARIVSGAAMIIAGVLMIGLLPSAGGLVSIGRPGLASRFTRVVARMLTTSRNKFRLGLALGFLPCGLIYAALLKAMESAGPVAGALTMLAFGLGTSVSLLAVGMASSFAGARFGRWSNRLAAAGIMIAGSVLLWRGLAAPHCHG